MTPTRTRIEGLFYRVFFFNPDSNNDFSTDGLPHNIYYGASSEEVIEWLHETEDQEFYQKAVAYAWSRRFRINEKEVKIWIKLMELLLEQIPESDWDKAGKIKVPKEKIDPNWTTRESDLSDNYSNLNPAEFDKKSFKRAVLILTSKDTLVDEIEQRDRTIKNLEQVHEEFLNTQLHFYKLAKPNTFSQFAASNPPALEIGHFLNFLESQWQNKEQQIKQVKHHLIQWITLITNRY